MPPPPVGAFVATGGLATAAAGFGATAAAVSAAAAEDAVDVAVAAASVLSRTLSGRRKPP